MMENIKYKLINYFAAAFFSFACALTSMQAVKYVFSSGQQINISKPQSKPSDLQAKQSVNYQKLIDSQFFVLSTSVEGTQMAAPGAEAVSNLMLLGTVSGDQNIARAMIRKKSDNITDIFKTGDACFGYKVLRIDNYKVYLKSGKDIVMLDMFAKEAPPLGPGSQAPGSNVLKNTLSRSDLQQKMQNSMDTMLKGLRAGPNRVGDVIDGFKIFAVPSDNMLYQLGIRNGDVIKRINGHPIDSTEKLYNLWMGFPKESRVVVDVMRGDQIVTLDYTMTN